MLVRSGPNFEMTLADYFRERLAECSAQLNPSPHEDTLWYIGSLLARFGNSDQLFSYENGSLTLRPLALLYKDAHETQEKHARCLMLRQLGDLALFLGSLFPENYARKGIRKDYFVGMGGGAYDYLAENAKSHRHIFSELSTTFARMLELVSQVCSKENYFDANDIIALYQRWLSTGDVLAEQQLQNLGISLSTQTLQ